MLLCVVLAMNLAYAQSNSSKKRKKTAAAYNKQSKEIEKFLEKQWWLGVKAGPNLSQPRVEKEYFIVSPTNYDLSIIAKKYDKFKQMGSQVTFEAAFYYRRFSFSFQPTYQHTAFAYSNTYIWQGGTNAGQLTQLNYEQMQKMDHLQLPVLIKYEIAGNRLRPYLQAGFYQGFLLGATKEVTISGIDNATGGQSQFKNESIIVGAKDLFAKKDWGLIGGAGLYYTVGNVRLNLDIMYKSGMSNITSAKNRVANDQLSGVADSMDDVVLDNVSVSLGCLFPLRFLENSFKSADRKK
jgi:hypothetical protein